MININQIVGLFTNADQAEIDIKYATKLQNARPINGKVVKTFDLASKLTDLGAEAKSIFTHLDDNHSTLNRQYIAAVVTGNTLTVYKWDTAWTQMTLSETMFTKDDNLSILQDSRILRIMSGTLAAAGSDEPKSLWYGWIDYDLFDAIYTASDYTAQFFNYPTNIDKVDLGVLNFNYSLITTTLTNGLTLNTDYYYKFAYVYDGIQEGLPSEPLKMAFLADANQEVEITYRHNRDTFNKRITSIKVYRSDTGRNGTYGYIQTIDYLRKGDYLIKKDSGGRSGKKYIYTPGVVTALPGTITRIDIYIYNSGAWEAAKTVTSPSSYQSAVTDNFLLDVELSVDRWEKDVAIVINGDGASYVPGSMVGLEFYDSLADGTAKSYSGSKTFLVVDATGTDNLIGDRIWYKDETPGDDISTTITNNYARGIYLTDVISTGEDDSDSFSYQIVEQFTGSYRAVEATVDGIVYINYSFYDIGIALGEEHPLVNETIQTKAIRVNGDFGIVVNGRMWVFNPILDVGVGQKNESQVGWMAYSEAGQLDVMPLQNVRKQDKDKGAITGSSKLFDHVIATTKTSIFSVNSRDLSPANWTSRESAHNIGNLAKLGMIEALGSVYVCHYDGIYRISANNLAESDNTPTESLKITDKIGDFYEALSVSNIESIVSEFDASTSEIIFRFPSNIYRYDVLTGNWREVLKESGVRYLWSRLGDQSLPDKFFILWVLSELEEYDTTTTLDLFRDRYDSPLSGRAFLLMNIQNLIDAGQKSAQPFLERLQSEIVSEKITDDNWIYFEEEEQNSMDSNIRSTAIILFALSKLSDENPILMPIVEYLTSNATSFVNNFNPQEAVWLLLALTELTNQHKLNVNLQTEVIINNKTLIEESIQTEDVKDIYTATIPIDDLRGSDQINELEIFKEGSGELYFNSSLLYCVETDSILPVEENAVITRNYYTLEDFNEENPLAELTSGVLYKGVLTLVVSEDASYIAIENPLPAGLKALSFNPAVGNISMQYEKEESARANGLTWIDNPLWLFDNYLIEDDRMILYSENLPAGIYKIDYLVQAGMYGKYNHLPATVKTMFNSDMYGRTEGGWMKVE